MMNIGLTVRALEVNALDLSRHELDEFGASF
jgi:hypothetical protein